MPHIVRITRRAQADIDETLDWLRSRSPQAAVNWHARLLDRVESLADNPEQWPLADEAADLGMELRQFLLGKRSGVFRILFTVVGNIVYVRCIRRASRDRLKPGDV